jgi:hypothetical protein
VSSGIGGREAEGKVVDEERDGDGCSAFSLSTVHQVS